MQATYFQEVSIIFLSEHALVGQVRAEALPGDEPRAARGGTNGHQRVHSVRDDAFVAADGCSAYGELHEGTSRLPSHCAQGLHVRHS